MSQNQCYPSCLYLSAISALPICSIRCGDERGYMEWINRWWLGVVCSWVVGQLVDWQAYVYNQMNTYDQQQNFLPRKLLDTDDLPETRSVLSQNDSEKQAVFSAPPILFDIGTRFYEDFLQEITQSDPELDKYGFVKSFHKKSEENIPSPTNNYRKLSLQTEEEYHSYYSVSVPGHHYYSNLTPQEQIMASLDQTARWARDQYGSRAVQSIIESGESYAKQAIFEALISQSVDLTKDKFGNYVFQKIFEKGQIGHKERLFAIVKQHILQFSENCYGCRVVQKAVEFAREKKEDQAEIVRLLEPYSLYLIQNINGNHVMQKCIEVIDLKLLSKVLKVISQNYKKLSLHAYGCRVIQKYLQKLHEDILDREDQLQSLQQSEQKKKKQRELLSIRGSQKEMFDKLLAISVELSQCQYGNYVMQHIVAHSKEYKPLIEQIFLDNFITLSCNKYASNVIERVIKLSSPQYRQKLALVLHPANNLIALAKHQFGNYVIQSLMQKISPQSKSILKSKLKENSQEISKSQYGRHVLVQVQKLK